MELKVSPYDGYNHLYANVRGVVMEINYTVNQCFPTRYVVVYNIIGGSCLRLKAI